MKWQCCLCEYAAEAERRGELRHLGNAHMVNVHGFGGLDPSTAGEARSADYKRGYEAGYRAGLRKTQVPSVRPDAGIDDVVSAGSPSNFATIREQWATGRYGDQTLRLRAEATVGLLDQLHAELATLRSTHATLQRAVEVVVGTFERAEAQGYRSRDRQYAIEILRQAQNGAPGTE